MISYCPNCSAQLSGEIEECWNCRASFGHGSRWAPTKTPTSAFTMRANANVTKTVLDEDNNSNQSTNTLLAWLVWLLFIAALLLLAWAVVYGVVKTIFHSDPRFAILLLALSFLSSLTGFVLGVKTKSSDAAMAGSGCCFILMLPTAFFLYYAIPSVFSP